MAGGLPPCISQGLYDLQAERPRRHTKDCHHGFYPREQKPKLYTEALSGQAIVKALEANFIHLPVLALSWKRHLRAYFLSRLLSADSTQLRVWQSVDFEHEQNSFFL